jgi:hypothetical protein
MPPIPSEQEPRYPHHSGRAPDDYKGDLDRVMSYRTWCERIGVSEATGRRLLASGRGPRVTRLSERRIGIRERDHLTWLDSRAVDAA